VIAREHHFVPQFYLRAFSTDGRRITLFNVRRDRLIHGASIKHQCSRRNFYAFAPGLESTFANIEGTTSRILRSIGEDDALPDIGSEDRAILLMFMVLQYLRTASAARPMDIMTDYYAKTVLAESARESGIDLEDFTIRQKDSVALPLSGAADVFTLAADLKVHLYVNRTARGFITSDAPVVLHNQYCEGIDFRGVLGWACRGLQVVLPLSPSHLVLLFDGGVYKVGASHRGCQVTHISDVRDVDQFNLLQILNAQENIYLKVHESDHEFERECRLLASKRPATRMKIVETDYLEVDKDHLSSLVHHYEPLLPMKLVVSDISVRRDARRRPLFERSMLYRDGRMKPFGNTSGCAPHGAKRYAVARVLDR
jgi:hypothetical protein